MKKDWKIAEKRSGAVCGCEVRPLQIGCAHRCAWGSESGRARCVRATQKMVATHTLAIFKSSFAGNENRCVEVGLFFVGILNERWLSSIWDTCTKPSLLLPKGFWFPAKVVLEKTWFTSFVSGDMADHLLGFGLDPPLEILDIIWWNDLILLKILENLSKCRNFSEG